jgi:hypothetical protein
MHNYTATIETTNGIPYTIFSLVSPIELPQLNDNCWDGCPITFKNVSFRIESEKGRRLIIEAGGNKTIILSKNSGINPVNYGKFIRYFKTSKGGGVGFYLWEEMPIEVQRFTPNNWQPDTNLLFDWDVRPTSDGKEEILFYDSYDNSKHGVKISSRPILDEYDFITWVKKSFCCPIYKRFAQDLYQYFQHH